MAKILGAIFGIGAILASTYAMSQEAAKGFPQKTVTIVVPFTAGGGTDILARHLATGLEKLWGSTVLVENRPGGGTSIGARHVVGSEADGYTLLFATPTLAASASVIPDLPYDIRKDLAPVGSVAFGHNAVIAAPNGNITSLESLVEEAKKRTVFYATSGAGTNPHFGAAHLADTLNIEMEAVHYAGGAELLVDLAAGRTDITYGGLAGLIGNVKGGLANPVVIMSEERIEALPDTPTILELGYTEAVNYFWFGLFAPAGTSPEVVAKINDDITTVMRSPESREFLSKSLDEHRDMSPEDFARFFLAEVDRFETISNNTDISIK